MKENLKPHPTLVRLAVAALALCFVAFSPIAQAGSAAEIDRDADFAWQKLMDENEDASAVAEKAVAVLIFPDITKSAFLVGGQYGEGVLRRDGKSVEYYSIAAGSIGLQAGVQNFAYVMMFMNEDAVSYLDDADGWEVGSGPSIVAGDAGAAGSLTTATYSDDVYTFTFDQAGLMAATGLKGSKITKIDPDS